MIQTTWPYIAVLLLCAGLPPALEKVSGWRLFRVLPPIVFTYLIVTALAVLGAWRTTPDIREVQQAVTGRLLPAMLFLLLATCDLKAVLSLGPRMLGSYLSAAASISFAFLAVYLSLRALLPADAWMVLSSVNASWLGGTANLIAVKQAIGMPDNLLAQALLTDALCYSVWVVALFSATPLAGAFNAWTNATRAETRVASVPAAGSVTPGVVVLWMGIALLVAAGAELAAPLFPTARVLTVTSWKLLLATAAGLVVARTPLARMPGSFPLATGLLPVLVAVMASQGSFSGLLSAPLFVLAGFMVLAIHALLMAGAAKLFRFDLALASVSSLANVGGVAAAPLLAATYSPALVPVGVLLAMLGYVLGTGAGLMMAALLSSLAPG